ncbi:hypothetical protein SAMN06265348_11423 [Pedobacter westerhofensis]|uniref:Uncharacterized protein n=1 Tax=Pedobacter westerhofensis TaxID=425512 RepID=A0A521FM53_9SPHI|nr:hypothetical protein SAMN06265348_11423 [Pedobacter westerhofensis]
MPGADDVIVKRSLEGFVEIFCPHKTFHDIKLRELSKHSPQIFFMTFFTVVSKDTDSKPLSFYAVVRLYYY